MEIIRIINWDGFIAGTCMMSVFFNIRDEDNRIYNIMIFITIMVISMVRIGK